MIENYIKGMVEISINGTNLERFVNKCNQYGITLYEVTRESYSVMTAVVILSDFRKLRKINREFKCKIRIQKRYGIRFLVRRIMHRWSFVLGMLIFAALAFILSTAIWRVEITGIDRVRATDVLNIVNDMNAGVGLFKMNCDTKKVEMAIKKHLPDVSWVIAKLDGTVLKIEIIESVEGEKPVDELPASIISEAEGEIVYVSALRGDQKVHPGDKVSVGQVLIDGIVILDEYTKQYIVRNAMGEVKARVEYTGRSELDMNQINSKKYTGNTFESSYISVFGLKLGGKKASPYEKYDTETVEYNIFSQNRLFPIYVCKTVYREYTDMTESELEESVALLLAKNAINDAMRLIPIDAEIENTSIEYGFDGDTGVYYAIAKTVAVHEIGVKKLLTDEQISGSKEETNTNE